MHTQEHTETPEQWSTCLVQVSFCCCRVWSLRQTPAQTHTKNTAGAYKRFQGVNQNQIFRYYQTAQTCTESREEKHSVLGLSPQKHLHIPKSPQFKNLKRAQCSDVNKQWRQSHQEDKWLTDQHLFGSYDSQICRGKDSNHYCLCSKQAHTILITPPVYTTTDLLILIRWGRPKNSFLNRRKKSFQGTLHVRNI